jgi:GT2 family glycosyltransferase
MIIFLFPTTGKRLKNNKANQKLQFLEQSPLKQSNETVQIGTASDICYMKISIIIATYNRNKILCDTIRNVLLFQKYYHELVVVDQTIEHDNETRLFLEGLVIEKKIIHLRLNYPNLPNARNEGIKSSTGDIIIFLDDDVEINEKFIPAHLSAYDNPDVGCTTGPVKVSNSRIKDNIVLKHCFSVKIVLKSIFFFFARRKVSYVSRFGIISNFSINEKRFADTGIGCNFAFRRVIFEVCDFFDINYTGNAIREDTDMCLRVKKAGYNIMYHPEAGLIHYMENLGGTRNSNVEDYWGNFFRNQCYFYIKNFSSAKFLIRLILTFDLLRCKKDGINALKLFSLSYDKARDLFKKS